MYPKWVEKAARLICEDCRGCGSVHDIIAIGVASASRKEASTGLQALLIVACPCCGERMSITVNKPMESIMEAMREFVRHSEETANGATPPIQLSPKKPVEPKLVREDIGILRPSVRGNQPDTPPTQREIQHFLHRLRTTSFKRSTKGFKNWMKDFGADPDKPVDGGE